MRRPVRMCVLIAVGLSAIPVAVNGVAYAGRWLVLRGRSDCDEALSLGTRVVAFASESVALAGVLLHLLLPSRLKRARSPVGRGPLVVLIPGLGFAPTAFSQLERRLRQQGWRPVTIRLPLWRLDMRAAVATVDASLRALQEPVFALIAFGAGGLVARDYLQRRGGASPRRFITLGTAHRGSETPWYRFGPWRQLRPDSETLRRITDDDLPRRCDVITIYSDFDALVVPAARGYYSGAFNIEVRGVGHFALARSSRVWELLAENLGAAGESAIDSTPAHDG